MTTEGSPHAAPPDARQGRGARRLWLVRHGETEGPSSIRYFGATDVPLADLGRAQIRALAPLLAELRFRAVVHSPLGRARESAQILLEHLREPPVVTEPEPGLSELDFGELEGKSVEEIEAEYPEWYPAWRAGRTDGYPGGDTLDGFAARVAHGIDAVLERHPEGDLCVVVHRGVVKYALGHLLGLPRDQVRHWPLDLASVTVVAFDGDRWTLERYNLVPGPW